MLIACCNSKIFMEVISFMNNKNSKVKKIVIAAMAVICAFSSATAITAGAKTTQYKHTVCVGGYPGGNDATWLSIKKNGTYTYDLFDGYPTVFNKKSSTVIKSRVEHKDKKDRTYYQSYTLRSNYSAPVQVKYGNLRSGSWRADYRYVSGGGCRANVTTMEKY